MPSPNPLPTKLKSLRGTTRKCREPKVAIEINKVTKAPPPPRFFNKTMKKIYRQQVDRMMFLEILEPSNINLAVAYAWTFGKWYEIAESEKIDDKTTRQAQSYLDSALKIGALIGADPVNTHKLRINNESKTIDGLEEFL